jgi:hypothetical protein
MDGQSVTAGQAPLPSGGAAMLRAVMLGNRAPEKSTEEVIELLGPALLSYLTSRPESDVAAHLSGESLLPAESAAALVRAVEEASMAIDLRRESASNDSRPPGPRESIFEALGALFVSPTAGVGFGEALRAFSGGGAPNITDPDGGLEELVLEHARNCLPGLLVPLPKEDVDRPWILLMGLSRIASWYGRGAEGRMLTALAADRSLRRFFPDLSGIHASSRRFLDSTGRGGGLQIVFLPGLVVQTAARRAGWPAPIEPDIYLAQIPVVLEEMRRAVAGEIVEIPAWVILNGLEVPDDFRLETRLGQLQSSAAWVSVVRRDPVRGQLMLRLTYPLSIERISERRFRLPERTIEAQREFRRRIDHLRLAVLLALRRPEPIALQVVSQEISNPFAHGPSESSPFFTHPFSSKIEPGDATLIASWSDKVFRYSDPSIELGGRRALSAATPGRDIEDRLVDAVVALENLIGNGSRRKPSSTSSRRSSRTHKSGANPRAGRLSPSTGLAATSSTAAASCR